MPPPPYAQGKNALMTPEQVEEVILEGTPRLTIGTVTVGPHA
jgi:hypothetical protein